ncbi:vWA domain-containing protein [Rhizobium sp. EC-SD404]|uniref:vWA domain-containing protein n=1 Tax=Rhizobium sp. EC-SD404 TaxID=2038389 RepID=UPI00125C4E08|nr:vWA domain-containing protein [Rhizobium sp. EC-SD404]VVT19782.1 putative von Willebrand factor type A [Rhizobium sp. EC-SD404]
MSMMLRRVVRMMRDRNGSFAIQLALFLPLLLAVASLAVDYTRALSFRSHAANAADAATLAAASKLALGDFSEDDARELAEVFFLSQIGQSGSVKAAELASLDPQIVAELDESRGGRTAEVRLSVEGSLEMLFPMWLMQRDSLTFQTESISVSSSETHSAFSMMLVLDQSGSMIECRIGQFSLQNQSWCDALGQTTRLTSLQRAVANLSQQLTVADPETNYVRMGATTYAESMKAERLPVWGTASTSQFVQTIRAGGNTDSSDAFDAAYKAVTRDRERIEHKNRNGQEQPARIILFMTDGENNSSSDTRYTLNRCEDAKKADVIIYSVAFEATRGGQSMLKDCASSADHYFEAASADQLMAAFERIGAEAANLLVRVAR